MSNPESLTAARRQGGFTMVELAIVLVILAVANLDAVTLQLLPPSMAGFLGFSWQVTLPLFLVILVSLAAGILFGFVWEWFREHKHRAEATRRRREADEPETEPTVDSAEEAPEEAPAEEAETPYEAPATPGFDPDDLGLPTEEGAVIRYLSNSYQGVGQKTAEALIEEFGADGVFNGLNSRPDRVKEILGAGRRTELLLEAWERDHRRRSEGAAGDKQPAGETA